MPARGGDARVMARLFDELKPLAACIDGQLVLSRALVLELLTRPGGGQPLDRDVAQQYMERFKGNDEVISLEEFCATHKEEGGQALPGFLVASLPADEYLDSDDETKNITDKEGDGPESSSDEGKDVVGDMEGTTQAWSQSGGSRESSFRRRDDQKKFRAQMIRSSCLTSHLVTPVFCGRKLVLDRPSPAAGGPAGIPAFRRKPK